MEFPMVTLVTFMHNHCLLQVLGRPQWLTVDGGRYIFVFIRIYFIVARMLIKSVQ
jgi:predicted NAD/FAD-binding protein